MPRGGIFDLSFLVLSSLAVGFAIVAGVITPGLAFPILAGWLVKLHFHE